jgi:ubiquinone/menaquinone biosynthesis C-methylase UbiE
MSNDHVKYDRTEDELDACINDPERRHLALTWLDQKNTLDSWRHNRMYSLIEPIVRFDSAATWLTVGDGRFGTDAHALIEMGAENVHASDMSDALLKIGNEKGFIREYSSQNAEFINFPNNSFDFVYCKEAYHHFPRPLIALHEMFRVAKTAVILTEPRDLMIDSGAFQFVLDIIKALLGRRAQQYSFEPVGNYIYTISERELEKFLLGMHYRQIAYNSINDAYEKGVEFVDLDSVDRKDKGMIRRIRRKILVQDAMDTLRIRKKALLSVTLFKVEANQQLKEGLISKGWKFKELPKNPYL